MKMSEHEKPMIRGGKQGLKKYYTPKDEHTRYYHSVGDRNPSDYGFDVEVEEEDV